MEVKPPEIPRAHHEKVFIFPRLFGKEIFQLPGIIENTDIGIGKSRFDIGLSQRLQFFCLHFFRIKVDHRHLGVF
jgi:hypothetical protein